MEPPEGICGFELRPEDHGVDLDIEEFRVWFGTACCWRETWQDGRCIWHAEVNEKPWEAIREARQHEWDENSALVTGDFSTWEHLDGAILDGVTFAPYFRFHKCNLQFSILCGAYMKNADFSDADIRWTDFSDAILAGSDLSNADLRGANLVGTNLEEADLPNADLREADLSGANLDQADLPYAFLNNADLLGAFLRNADLSNTIMRGAELSGAFLGDADMSDSVLSKASLSDAILAGADLSNTDFREANLTGAAMDYGEIGEFEYDVGTQFGGRSQWEDPPILDQIRAVRWHRRPLFILKTGLFGLHSTIKAIFRNESTEPTNAELQYRATQAMLREDPQRRELPELDVREKDARRRRMRRDGKPLQWLALAGARWVTLYGESPWRVIYTSLAVIAASALAFSAFGTIGVPDGSFAGPASLKPLYFSVVTFTTLGYGDVQPVGQWAQLLSMTEALVGAALMALLVTVLARRITR